MARRRTKKTTIKLDPKQIEYVIYVRKSTDDGDRQVQSIVDQITDCVNFAKEQGLQIAHKPKDFSAYETARDIRDEQKEQNPHDKEVYEKYKDLFIIKEKESAMTPNIRNKRNNLIKDVRSGSIQGIISYAPDRQARNLREGGQLVTLVDEGFLDLKYTNFHFENTAAGKMMLGFLFVFAKQYSDAISESVNRGTRETLKRGKNMGNHKRGYKRDEDSGYLKPDLENFALMKEAFQKRLEGENNINIANRLNSMGFHRIERKKKVYMTANILYTVWRDPFYYGLYTYGDQVIDQRESNPYYQAMITEEEFLKIQETLDGTMHRSSNKEKSETDEIKAIRPGMIEAEDGSSFTLNIPNLARHKKRLEKVRAKDPTVTLSDIIKPNQIHFKVSRKSSEYNNYIITLEDIYKVIHDSFEGISISEDAYKEYVMYMKEDLQNLSSENKDFRKHLEFTASKIRDEKDKFIENNLGIKRSQEEENVYQKKLANFNERLNGIKEEMENLDQDYDSKVISYEQILSILGNFSIDWEDFEYVRVYNFIDFFASNIFVNKEKELRVERNPLFLSIINNDFRNGAGDETRTRNNLLGRQEL